MSSASSVESGGLAEPGSPVDRVVRRYLGIVSRFAFTRQTAVEYGDDGANVWTVIDADTEDRAARQQIYEAELAATDVAPDAAVSFRLLNQREYSPEAVRHLVSTSSPFGQRQVVIS